MPVHWPKDKKALRRRLLQLAPYVTVDVPLGVAFLDVDHFKQVNEATTHAKADEVLGRIHETCVALIGPSGECYVYGGDELIILFPNRTSDEIFPICKRLVKTIAALTWSGFHPHVPRTITVSVGLTAAPHPSSFLANLEEVIEDAEVALKVAKTNGGDMAVQFDPSFKGGGAGAIVFVAVINPNVFELLQKRMRFAFVTMNNYGTQRPALASSDFAVTSVLGTHDLLLGHIAASSHRMLEDVAGLKISHRHGQIPYFSARAILKYKGKVPRELKRDTLISTQEARDLWFLVNDWNSSSVGEDRRKELLDKGYLLGQEPAQPRKVGVVEAVLLLSVSNRDADGVLSAIVHNKVVLPRIFDGRVRSIYRGIGHGSVVESEYLMHLTCDAEDLSEFIEDLHTSAAELLAEIATRTYIVTKRWARQKYPELLVPPMDEEHGKYRDVTIRSHLTREEFAKLERQEPSIQIAFIESARRLLSTVDALPVDVQMRVAGTEKRHIWLLGLMDHNSAALLELFVSFVLETEKYLRAHLQHQLGGGDAAFQRGVKEKLFQSNREGFDRLTFGELVGALNALQRTETDGLLSQVQLAELTDANAARNDLVHGRAKKVRPQRLVELMSSLGSLIQSFQAAAGSPEP